MVPMPRQLRIEYEGAIYHVINRGDRREPIFRDGKDRELFLATLGAAAWLVFGVESIQGGDVGIDR
jgi:hypothetical protein